MKSEWTVARAIAGALILAAFLCVPALALADSHEDDPLHPPYPSENLPEYLTDPDVDLEHMALLLLPLTEEELATLAAEWQQIVKEMTKVLVAATIEAQDYEGERKEELQDHVAALTVERNELFDKYSLVVDDWEKKAGNADQVAEYRAYKNSIIVEELRTVETATLLNNAQNWLVSWDGGLGLLVNIAGLIFAVVVIFFIARTVRRLTRRGLGHLSNLSNLMEASIVVVAYWLTFAIGLMIALSLIGLDVTPMFALLGGATFILAFALQETIGSLFSGIMIIVNRPFDVGDFVDFEGIARGKISHMTVMTTTVMTPDNQKVVIQNKRVWDSVITNLTASEQRRVDLVFGVSYDTDIEKAHNVLMELAKAHPLTLDEPETQVWVGELADSSVNLLCRPWVNADDYWTVYWDLTRQVKERFDVEGISIPFPQREVHMFNGDPIPSLPDDSEIAPAEIKPSNMAEEGTMGVPEQNKSNTPEGSGRK